MYISIVPLHLWDSSQGGGVKAFGPILIQGNPGPGTGEIPQVPQLNFAVVS